jgi:hypothetical protein
MDISRRVGARCYMQGPSRHDTNSGSVTQERYPLLLRMLQLFEAVSAHKHSTAHTYGVCHGSSVKMILRTPGGNLDSPEDMDIDGETDKESMDSPEDMDVDGETGEGSDDTFKSRRTALRSVQIAGQCLSSR